MILEILATDVAIPVGWLLTALLGLAGVISTLATVIWSTMKERLRIQDEIIKRLQDDIDRISKGCGADNCLWNDRK